ncbi:MAG: hypothetical protein GXY41_07550 [Phycisphaerae bacterium]|nr:hypothetical protein [Phycisphaerae bacterium]
MAAEIQAGSAGLARQSEGDGRLLGIMIGFFLELQQKLWYNDLLCPREKKGSGREKMVILDKGTISLQNWQCVCWQQV